MLPFGIINPIEGNEHALMEAVDSDPVVAALGCHKVRSVLLRI